MRAHLRAGIAIYNEGRYHAAHDAWEDHWLDLPSGTDDEQLLHGLIQCSAVVYHAHNENWSGATGLAESAIAYLDGLPDTYRGVDLATLRTALGEIAAQPTPRVEAPPPMTLDESVLGYDDLDIDATAIAARVLAEEDGYDVAAVERATAFAREEIDADVGGQFTGLVFAFVRDRDRRPVVAQRLVEHVRRRQHRAADVAGLFD